MRVGKRFIFAAAVLAVTMFGPSDAGAWGYSRHGYGSHFGFGQYFGLGRHYGYGRHHGFRGRGHFRRGHAFLPVYPRPARPAPTASTANPSSGCRTFTTSIVVDGAARTVTGTACRQGDGSWRIVDWR